MLQVWLIAAVLTSATGPSTVAGPERATEPVAEPVIVTPAATAEFPMAPAVVLEQTRAPTADSGVDEAHRVEQAQRTDLGQFIYGVALGVAVTVISALILRVIL